jgi:hypothetical protein
VRQSIAILSPEKLRYTIGWNNAPDLFIAGRVDGDWLILVYGDLHSICVPLSAFHQVASGPKPDPSRLSIEDYGQTVCLGEYEIAADWLRARPRVQVHGYLSILTGYEFDRGKRILMDPRNGRIYSEDEIKSLPAKGARERLVEIPQSALATIEEMGPDARKAWARERQTCSCGHRRVEHSKHGSGRCRGRGIQVGRCICQKMRLVKVAS